MSAPSPAPNLEGRSLSLSLCPKPRAKAVRLLPEERSSSLVHTNSLTRRKTPSTTCRYQRGRLRLLKLIRVPKPHHASFKIPSLFHTINGISKLKNWGTPSPAANFHSLILACCKHQVVNKPPAYTLRIRYYVATLPSFSVAG